MKVVFVTLEKWVIFPHLGRNDPLRAGKDDFSVYARPIPSSCFNRGNRVLFARVGGLAQLLQLVAIQLVMVGDIAGLVNE
ncbi:MAG: hypothetical protein C0619_15015 [Desulfuromonas sp.]|nr:MAG: hypothetical protein C0619_15015 [Desulfuromonas sp.]